MNCNYNKKNFKKKKFKPPLKDIPLKNCPSYNDQVRNMLKNNDLTKNEQPENENVTFVTDLNVEMDCFKKSVDCLQPLPSLVFKNINKKALSFKQSKETSLGGVIFSSLNVLNDDNLDNSQEVQISTQLTNSSSVKNLSFSRNTSFSSVTTENRTYMNLDFCNNVIDRDSYNIPFGEDFCNMFNVKTLEETKVGPTAMSTNFGDMGFNVKYADFIRSTGYQEESFNGATHETVTKILTAYPKENKIFIKINFKI